MISQYIPSMEKHRSPDLPRGFVTRPKSNLVRCTLDVPINDARAIEAAAVAESEETGEPVNMQATMRKILRRGVAA